MAPAPSKTNFKTYDVQARLLRALFAAHPEVKWDVKKIAECYGTDISEYALQHKMRHVKTQAAIIRTGLEAGCDPANMPTNDGDFPKDQNKIDVNNIHKYFGLSTPDGLGWHFREVKRDAKSIKEEVDKNGNALSIDIGGSIKSTPTKGRGTGSAKPTPASRQSMTKTASPRKRKGPEASTDGNDDSGAVDYSELDQTPSPTRRVKKIKKEVVKAEATNEGMSFDGTIEAAATPKQVTASRSFAELTSEDDFEVVASQTKASFETRTSIGEYPPIGATIDPSQLHGLEQLYGCSFDDQDGII